MKKHSIFNKNNNPETLYKSCIRTVSRNLCVNNFVQLKVLPPIIKTQLILNATRHSAGYGLCKDFAVIRSLLHGDMLHLDLSMYPDITDQMLREISEAAPNLHEFCIANQPDTKQLTSEGLIEHITKLKKLRALQISDVLSMNDVVLSAITRDCSQIVVLEVNNNSNITDGCAAVIKELKLSKLNLARTAITDNFLNVIEGGTVGKYMDEINLNNCAVTSAGLEKLRWDKLKYIGFEGAVITDLNFIKKMGNLKSIQWTISA